ncbi:MAG: hypothetical protein ACREVP_07675 [Burkholderiales bacterium]
MAASVEPAGDALLSVSQFAARERVSRVRVLQLLGARRLPGARRIGHQWAIPASTAIVRRTRGRPRKRASRPVDRLLRTMAKKYVWWLSPREAAARPDLVITQVMDIGDYEDACRLEAALGREALARALGRAEAGRLSERSWTYWHYRLGRAAAGRVPPRPKRVLP